MAYDRLVPSAATGLVCVRLKGCGLGHGENEVDWAGRRLEARGGWAKSQNALAACRTFSPPGC